MITSGKSKSRLLIFAEISIAALVVNYVQEVYAVEPVMNRHFVVNLEKTAQIGSSHVYLTDIAKCVGDAAQCKEVLGTEISRAPVAGRVVSLTRSQIEKALSREWSGATYYVEGAESVLVSGVASDIRSEDIKRSLQGWIDQQVGVSEDFRILVTKAVIPFGSGVRPSQTKIEFPDLERLPLNQPNWVSKNLNGVRLMQFRFQNPVDQDDSQIVSGQSYFQIQRRVPVAREYLQAGSVISEDSMKEEWVTWRPGIQDVSDRRVLILGKKIKNAMSAGDTFSLRNLDEPKAVARNQEVILLIKSGDISVSAKARMMDDGRKGQMVDVINVANKKRLRARVIDENTVEAVTF